MDEEGSFVFYESGYLTASFAAFQDMRMKGEHTDLIMKTSDAQFSVHRVVVAARIPHFRKILISQDKEMSVNNMNSDVLEAIINFAYEGKLKVTIENVQAMIFAAVCLHLRKVQKACLEFMAKRFKSNNEVKTINIIPSDASIRNNFDEFCNSLEFPLLPYYSLKELLGRDDLRVTNEEKVFEALIKWIAVSPTERQHHLPYLLPQIRMNYISPEYLIKTVAAEIFIETSVRAKQIVQGAKSYHLSKKRPRFLSFNSNSRLYTGIQDSASFNLSSSTETNDLIPDETSNVSPSYITVANQNTSMSSEARNGIYSVRSFSGTGTCVSYYNYRNGKWDDFTTISRSDVVLHVVSVDTKLYVFFPKSIETFHLVTRRWETVELLSFSTEGSGVASQDNKIYVFGGVHDPNQVRCFDTVRNTWLENEPMRTPCHSMSVFPTQTKFVLLTGGSSTFCIDEFSLFHTITKQWTAMKSMITCRMNHDSAVACGKLYVCGGCNDKIQLLETVEVYDTVSQQWSLVPYLKISRLFPSLISWRRKLYVFGGETEREKCSRSVEVYDPETAKLSRGLNVQPLYTCTNNDLFDGACCEETLPVSVKAVVMIKRIMETSESSSGSRFFEHSHKIEVDAPSSDSME